MRKLRKPLSILLSLIMILSVFTTIPMSASAGGSLTDHAQASPTYVNGVYKNGTTQAYYTGEDDGVYFVSDGNGSYTQISEADLFTVPYFEYEYLSDSNTVRLVKCNSDDADITVPDAIPAQFYPSDAPGGVSCSIIKEEAFKNRSSLVSVTIGDNVNHIAGADSYHGLKGAFYGCSNLESVSVGSGLDHVGYSCFYQCYNLAYFTTTSTREGNFSGVATVAYTNRDERDLIVHCYHDSGIARGLCDSNDDYDYYVDFVYLDELYDEEPVEHTAVVDWDWDEFNTDGTVTAYIDCTVCKRTWVVDATVEQVVDTPAACTTAGSGHYKATVTFDGHTFTDTDRNKHKYTIPATGHTYSEDASTYTWTWTPADGDNPGANNISAHMNVPCTACDYVLEVNATVTSATNDGITTYTATAEFDGKTYTGTKEVFVDGIGARLAGHTVSLEGDIGVNFYMELSDSAASHADTAYMQFTFTRNGSEVTQKVHVKDAVKKASGPNTYYLFKCRVFAEEMTTVIKARMIDGGLQGTEYSYSVQDYAKYLLDNAYEDDGVTVNNQQYAEAVPLVRAMLNYGARSQTFFNSTNPPANSILENNSPENVDPSELAGYGEYQSTLSSSTAFKGSTLSLQSETTLSLYFESDDTLSFECGDYTVERAVNGNYQIARIRGIRSKDLLKSLTLTVTADNGEEQLPQGTISCSPMNYCYGVLSGSGYSYKLSDTVKSLYLYAKAAAEYFPEAD